MEEGAEGNIWA